MSPERPFRRTGAGREPRAREGAAGRLAGVNEFIVITGLSGAGRSQAADILEDLGWFVIDNLPPALIPKVSELASSPGSDIAKVVLVVGTGPYHDEVLPALKSLEHQGARLRIVFLEASTDVLVRRYESTRRRHPLAIDRSLAEAIEAERELLEPVKEAADVVVDTSDLNVHQLRDRVLDLFGEDAPEAGMQTTVTSFGYKHGLPARHRPGHRLPVPAQPALGRGAATADRSRRAGAGLRAGSGHDRGVPRRARLAARAAAAGLHP